MKKGGNPGMFKALNPFHAAVVYGFAALLTASSPAFAAGDSAASSVTSKQVAGQQLALFGFGKKEEAAPASPPPPKPKDLFCPKVQVQSGTAAHIVYERGRENEPLGVKYQVRFSEFARECVDLGAEIGIRVGIAARALVGPLGKSGQALDVPIRFVVLDDKQKVVMSRVTRLQVAIPAGQNGITFTHVEDLGSVPFPGNSFRKWELRVGFDTKPPGSPQG